MHNTATSGFAALIAFRASSETFTLSGFAQTGHLAEVPADLGRIDIDGADDLESLAPRNLPDDPETDGTQPEMQHPDGA